MTNDTVQMNRAYANPLCEKLQNEFRNRGANAPGLASKVTSREAVQRVAAGLDPYERVETTVRPTVDSRTRTMAYSRPAAQQMTSSGAAAATVTAQAPRVQAMPRAAATANPWIETRTAAYPGRKIQTLDYVDKGVRARSRTFEDRHNRGFVLPEGTKVPGYTRAYRSAERVRNTAAQYYKTRQQEMTRPHGLFAVPAIGPALEVTCDAAVAGAEKCRGYWRRLTDSCSAAEERIASSKRNVPVGAIMLAVVFTVLLLVIVYSFSQVYEIKNEMSNMEAKQGALAAEQNELNLDLEVRDDIRVIQQIAVDKLGMVSSGSVESRYVSVSGGERIELGADAAASDSTAASGTVFSALTSKLAGLKYYFN